MKKTILAAIVGLAFVPTLAFGDGLRLYADGALTQCTLADTSPGPASVYVAYSAEHVQGSIGARFRVAPSSGFTGSWVSDATPFAHIGTSQSDFSIAFGECKKGTFLILTVTYQLLGTSACSNLAIAPPAGFPLSAAFCFADCWSELPCQNNSPLYVNCDGSFDCNPVAVESSTWGRVKALYRD